MKISFICDTMNAGGAERVISILSNEFAALGNDVSIVALSREASVSFYPLHPSINFIKFDDFLSNKRFFVRKVFALRRLLLAEQPDIVISFLSYVCIYTCFALRGTKIPYIVSERNNPYVRSRFKQFLLNYSFKKASGCVFQTEDAEKFYKKYVRANSRIIFNPVNLPNELLNKRVEKKDKIISVGRLVEQKNYFLLIDAFEMFLEKNPSFILKIYGEGVLYKELLHYIEQKGLLTKIQLCGHNLTWHSDEQDSKLYALSSKYEGMPNGLAEALCLGITSVSTDIPIGGPKQLKKHFRNLFLCSSMDAADFAQTMEEAIHMKDLNPEIPDVLKVSFVIKEWLELINKILVEKQ